jgi:hypothetical protein
MSDITKRLAETFLRWPLPPSVCADHCTTYPVASDNPALQRVGTNLLSYNEAEQMMREVVEPEIEQLRARLEIALAGHRENEISARIVEFENLHYGLSHQIMRECGFIKDRARAALKETP